MPHYRLLQTKSSGFGVGEVFGFRTAGHSFLKRSKDPDRLIVLRNLTSDAKAHHLFENSPLTCES